MQTRTGLPSEFAAAVPCIGNTAICSPLSASSTVFAVVTLFHRRMLALECRESGVIGAEEYLRRGTAWCLACFHMAKNTAAATKNQERESLTHWRFPRVLSPFVVGGNLVCRNIVGTITESVENLAISRNALRRHGPALVSIHASML